MTWFFTADEHYGHERIIDYCDRPFTTVAEMNAWLINSHNMCVGPGDVTVHCGDFGFFRSWAEAQEVIQQLNGSHIFIKGSHDRWLPKNHPMMWRKTLLLPSSNERVLVTACHYAMRTWERAHYGSWQVYGHSHGNLPPHGKQWDVGVDNNGFEPVSLGDLEHIMARLDQLHGPEHDEPQENPN